MSVLDFFIQKVKVLERINLATPHMSGYEMEYVNEAFETNWIAPLGKNVNMFEEEMSAYVGTKTGAALSAGTAAIHMGLKAAGVKKGDIVFCSSLTFSASANPIVYEGAIPVFIDSDYVDWNMDPKALELAFEKYPQCKVVVTVDLYGQSCRYDEIKAICKKHGAVIVEDSAEALGTTYKGKQCGSLTEFGVLSFNGNKIITTSGGGMLMSNDEEKIAKVRFWSTQSREQERHYQHSEIGYNYRMSNISAGIGRGQLKVLDQRVAKKREIYNTYKDGFKDIPYISMAPETDDCVSNHWLSCLILTPESPVKTLDIIIALEKENIECRPIWKPMHMQPVFEGCDFVSSLPQAASEDIFARGVCLPSDTKMTKEEQERVINSIKALF